MRVQQNRAIFEGINNKFIEKQRETLIVWQEYIPSFYEILQEKIDKKIKIEPIEVVYLLKIIFKLIFQIHSYGLFHGNIKPQNIHLKLRENNKEKSYVNIEQEKDYPYSDKSSLMPFTDVYSLGVIGLILLNPGNTKMNSKSIKLDQLLENLYVRCKDGQIPKQLFQVIHQMVSQDPDQRPILEYCAEKFETIEYEMTQLKSQESVRKLTKKELFILQKAKQIEQIKTNTLKEMNSRTEHKNQQNYWIDWNHVHNNMFWWKEYQKYFHGELIGSQNIGIKCFSCWNIYQQAQEQIDSLNNEILQWKDDDKND
ncbi:Protein kinase-like domain [Pseudocohnilembus persalinus]|uniref:Protein kinase-like domain n=1 Tax=Pseudocohnilembus persalinus TaxID=266149 RepID=A0A0V0R3V8_PSEPJ|nr:Protein kinase-like domain [Pseudocohnilembus persalinus]|eukprot:KRX09180.1 Protein kinase-like domain [Pseudocohnilembus persalinus]